MRRTSIPFAFRLCESASRHAGLIRHDHYALAAFQSGARWLAEIEGGPQYRDRYAARNVVGSIEGQQWRSLGRLGPQSGRSVAPLLGAVAVAGVLSGLART